MCYSSSVLALILLALATFSVAKQSDGGGGDGGGGGVTMELWCVAKNNAEDTALQAAIDWACGSGGADCGPIQQGGPCYFPDDVVTTASYPFNDYYLKHGLSQDSCDFDNNAALTSLNPSRGKCKLPSSVSVGGGNSTGSAGEGIANMSYWTCISSKWNLGLIAIIMLIQTHTWAVVLHL